MTDEKSFAFPHENDESKQYNYIAHGLTKRELFAAMILQGYYAGPCYNVNDGLFDRAQIAIQQADALLKGLAK